MEWGGNRKEVFSAVLASHSSPSHIGDVPEVTRVTGKVISGLFGDTTILISHSYAADTVDGKSLTLRVIILEFLGISGMVAGIIGGEWLKAAGYAIFVIVRTTSSI